MMNYCVYEHVFPNGKRYIGISNNPVKRWRNGEGYSTQPKVYRAIKKYGWDHIQHNIIIKRLTQEQAKTLEKYLIALLNTIEHGYNETIGGDHIRTYFIDSQVAKKLRQYKVCYGKDSYQKNCVVQLIDEAKNDSELANLVNEAHSAVTRKHGTFKGDADSLDEYFYHMFRYFDLNQKILNGEDVSNWKEESLGEFVGNYFIKILRK